MRFAMVVILMSALFAADKPITWETAVVISQDLTSSEAGTYSGPVGNNGRISTPIYRRSNVVIVDTGQYRCEWQEQGRSAVTKEVPLDSDKYAVITHERKPKYPDIVGREDGTWKGWHHHLGRTTVCDECGEPLRPVVEIEERAGAGLVAHNRLRIDDPEPVDGKVQD